MLASEDYSGTELRNATKAMTRRHFSPLGFASAIALFLVTSGCATAVASPKSKVRVGAAAVAIKADDSMIIGGGIHGGTLLRQEGELRASAVVIEGEETAAIVACDILMIRRDYLDAAARAIEERLGIPMRNVLINATHTHHAPSTATIHAYKRDETFCARTRDAVVEAVTRAHARMKASEPTEMLFRLGIESTVGQNSRYLLDDGKIYWTGPRDGFVRPTAPFDPELPVIAFRRSGAFRRGGAGEKPYEALIYNHSTHLIGTTVPGARSPSFYGLAAQELEKELGGTVVFVSGAFGSTHNLTLSNPEMVLRIQAAIRDALGKAVPVDGGAIRGLRREVAYRVRRFDEEKEEKAVSDYCEKYVHEPESVISVFRKMRKELAPHQGEERKTWIQALRLGDVAWVTAPGEFFTVLGIEIKRRSPFRYTYVAGVANDYVGYIPDEKGFDQGGYQVWTGFHSLVERGTGERFVSIAVELLEELRQ